MASFQGQIQGISGGDLALGNPFLAGLQLPESSAPKEPNPLAPLLERMDGIEDPFERMAFALYVLMPAMIQREETELEELAEDLSEDARYVEELSRIKQLFNGFADGTDAAKVEEFQHAVETLLEEIHKSSAVTPSIKEQITKALGELAGKMDALGPEGSVTYFKEIWKFQNVDDAQKQAGELKYWEDRFQITTTSLTSVSSIVQAEFQYYAARYQTLLAAYKDMLKKFFDQKQHAVEQMRS